MFEFFIAGYHCKNQTLAGVFVMIGILCFLTVLGLMGKIIDKGGWE
jgi:hypothetical protein